MRMEAEQAGALTPKGGARRTKRKLNGMAATSGLADPPTRARLTRTLALLNAALRVWETNHPRRAKVWRRA